MKKIIAALCAAVICISFASCSNSAEKSNTASGTEKTTLKLSSNLSQTKEFEMYSLSSEEKSKLKSLIENKSLDKTLVIKSLKINGENVEIINPSCTTIVYNIPDTETSKLDIKAEFSSKTAKVDIDLPDIKTGKNTVTLTAVDNNKYNRYEIMVYRYDESTLKVYKQYIKLMEIYELSDKIFKFDSKDFIKQNNMVYYNITNYDEVMKANLTETGQKLMESYVSERLIEKNGKHYGMIVDFEPNKSYNGFAMRYYIDDKGNTNYLSRSYVLTNETEAKVQDSVFTFNYIDDKVLAERFILPI